MCVARGRFRSWGPCRSTLWPIRAQLGAYASTFRKWKTVFSILNGFSCVFSSFPALSPYPFGLKEGAPLAMYPSVVFPYPCTLRTIFSLRHCFYPDFGGLRANSAQRCVDKELFVLATFSAMDFSNAGVTEPVGDAFRAHVQWRDNGFKYSR